MRSVKGEKYQWTPADIQFLKDFWPVMDNRELAKKLNIGLTLVRSKCYELGLYRMRMYYWTLRQEKFLRKMFKTIGDKELAEIFNKKFPQKKWTFKHIEKKRNYLNLHRTEKQLKAIKRRNIAQGRFALCPVKRWQTMGVMKEGTIRMWRTITGRLVPYIKINGKFVHWARWAYKNHFGRIPKKKNNVIFRDNNPWNQKISNLIAVSNAELARRNSKISSQGLSDNYVASMLAANGTNGKRDRKVIMEMLKHPELIQAKRKQLILQRIIEGKHHGEKLVKIPA